MCARHLFEPPTATPESNIEMAHDAENFKPRRLAVFTRMLDPGRAVLTPEKRLMFKMIVLAGVDLVQTADRRIQADTYKWVSGEENPRGMFSFKSCCEHLDLECESLRAAFLTIARLKDAGKRKKLRGLLASALGW